MKPVLFLDVDGTILPSSFENADMVKEIKIPVIIKGSTRTVHGFTWTTEDKTIWDTEEIPVKNIIHQFLKEHHNDFQIVWLTGWENKVRFLEPIFGLPECEVLLWDKSKMNPQEIEKKDALKAWLVANPQVERFIWADDCATLAENNDDLKKQWETLIISPDPFEAFNEKMLQQMKDFL